MRVTLELPPTVTPILSDNREGADVHHTSASTTSGDLPSIGAGGDGGDVGDLLAYPGVTVIDEDGDEDSPVAAFIKSRAPGDGRDSVIWRLNAAAKLMGYADYTACPYERWRRPQMLKLRNKLADKVEADTYVPRTAREILGNVRSVLREARRQGYLSLEELGLTLDVPKIGGSAARREVVTATDADITRCLIVCEADRGGQGVRDAALVALSSLVGLRSIEYHALDLADINREAQTVTVRRGKGRRNRTVYFGVSFLPYLDDYLAQRGTAPGPFFVRLTKNGKLWRGRLDRLATEAIRYIFLRRSTEAGRPLPSHAFRRCAATRVVDLTGNSALASAILGHASKVTLDLYYNPATDTKRQAAEQVVVPGPRMYERGRVTPGEDEPPAAPVHDRLAAVLGAMVAQAEPKKEKRDMDWNRRYDPRKIEAARKAKGVSIEALAQVLQIYPSWYDGYIVRADTLDSMFVGKLWEAAELLGVTEDAFLRDAG